MAFKAHTFTVPAQQENSFLKFDAFEGINLGESPTQIRKNESPDMLNLVLDDQGALDSRPGFGKLFATAVGTGQVYGMYAFKNTAGTTQYLLHVGTVLYNFLLDGTQPTVLYSSMTAALSNYFTFNNKCYIMDTVNYLQYDGTTVVTVDSIAYVPTLTLARAPTGGGTASENFNFLGTGFKDSFSGTAATTVYQLSLALLDATLVTATVNGVAKLETTDFTVNRTTGAVTFTVAPGLGADNVVITAYKTVSGNANRIKNCKAFVIYGGTNDTRVFWACNINFPNYLFRSGLFDPTYAPNLAFTKVGSDAGIIQGFAKQFSSCVIFKENTPNDTTQYIMSYLDTSGTITFPIIPLVDDIGVVSPRSIQTLNGIPVSHTQKGVFYTVGSNVKDERDVEHISFKIDRSYNSQIQALLSETLANQQAAISVDYDKKYILVVNNRAYVYDYQRSDPTNKKYIWYIWDNIHASCFLEINDYLYFGSNTTGLIYKFLKSTDTNANSDDGTAINKYWKSRIESFNVAYRYKTVPNVYLSIKPALRTSAMLYTIDDQGETLLQDTIVFSQFSFSNFDFSNFSFITTNFPQILPSRVKAKKILYFQVLISNNTNNESLGILEVNIEYTVNGLAK